MKRQIGGGGSIAALQAQIRREGRAAGRARATAWAAAAGYSVLVAAGMVLLMVALHAAGITGSQLAAGWTVLLTSVCVALLIPPAVLVDTIVARILRRRRDRLGRALARLPNHKWDAVLGPLLGSPDSGVRELAEMLLKDRAPRGELSPAPPHEGGGNVVSPSSTGGTTR